MTESRGSSPDRSTPQQDDFVATPKSIKDIPHYIGGGRGAVEKVNDSLAAGIQSISDKADAGPLGRVRDRIEEGVDRLSARFYTSTEARLDAITEIPSEFKKNWDGYVTEDGEVVIGEKELLKEDGQRVLDVLGNGLDKYVAFDKAVEETLVAVRDDVVSAIGQHGRELVGKGDPYTFGPAVKRTIATAAGIGVAAASIGFVYTMRHGGDEDEKSASAGTSVSATILEGPGSSSSVVELALPDAGAPCETQGFSGNEIVCDTADGTRIIGGMHTPPGGDSNGDGVGYASFSGSSESGDGPDLDVGVQRELPIGETMTAPIVVEDTGVPIGEEIWVHREDTDDFNVTIHRTGAAAVPVADAHSTGPCDAPC